MYQPTAFSDGKNIIIRNNIPYFLYTGSTYKDKLKNGLSLEYVFEQEDMNPIEYEEVFKEVKLDDTRVNLDFMDYEENYHFYEQKELQTQGLMRKGKWLPFKKGVSRNTKKNSNRLDGYVDKLFNIEQNLPELSPESEIIINYESYDIIDDDSFLCHFCGLTCNYCSYYVRGYDSDDDNWSYN